MDASSCAAVETLRGGRKLEIRALRPEDEAAVNAARDAGVVHVVLHLA